jgi:hypothetical protein
MPDSEIFEGAESLNKSHHVNNESVPTPDLSISSSVNAPTDKLRDNRITNHFSNLNATVANGGR